MAAYFLEYHRKDTEAEIIDFVNCSNFTGVRYTSSITFSSNDAEAETGKPHSH